MNACQGSSAPGPLQVVASADAVHIQQLSSQIKALSLFWIPLCEDFTSLTSTPPAADLGVRKRICLRNFRLKLLDPPAQLRQLRLRQAGYVPVRRDSRQAEEQKSQFLIKPSG